MSKSSDKPEQMLISSILRNSDLAVAYTYGLDKKMFHVYKNQFEWIDQFYLKHQKVPSKAAFSTQFPTFVRKEADDTVHFTQLVRDEYKRRCVEDTTKSILEHLDDNDFDGALHSMYTNAIKIQSDMGLINDGDVFSDNGDIMKEFLKRKERFDLYGASGIPTGFPTFDERSGGFGPGEFAVLAARPGSKKSWLLQPWAAYAALKGYKVQFNALEQPRANVMARIVSLISKEMCGEQFSAQNLIRGRDYDYMAFQKFINELEQQIKGRLHVADGTLGKVTTSMIASQIERNHPDVVFIDHITLMGRGSQDWSGVAQVADEIVQLGNQYNIPMVSAAQLNRNGVSKDAGLESIAEADKIGQNASLVMFSRPMSKRIIFLDNQKERNGEGGFGLWLHFQPEIGIFKEVDYDTAQLMIEEDEEKRQEVENDK